MSNIYRRLMTSTEDTNEFYELRLPQDWKQRTFWELQQQFTLYNTDVCQAISPRTPKKNTILLVAFIRKGDTRRTSIFLNPEPSSVIEAGDTLVFLSYKFDQSSKERLMEFLMSQDSASPA